MSEIEAPIEQPTVEPTEQPNVTELQEPERVETAPEPTPEPEKQPEQVDKPEAKEPSEEPDWEALYAKAESFEERADIYEQKQKYLEEQSKGEEKPEQAEPEVKAEEPEAPKEEKPVEEEKAPEPELHKIKVDGEEKEVDINELKRGYQMAEAAQKRFNEAAEIRKSNEEFELKLKNSPFEALQERGIDVDKLAQDYIAEKAEYELMTEEQKKIFDLEKKIQEVENQKKFEEEKAAQIAFEKEQAELVEHYKTAVPEALETAGIVVNDFTQARVRHYMLQYIDNGFNEVEPEHVMNLVKDELQSIQKSLSTTTPKKMVNTVTKPVKVAKEKKKEAPVGSEDFEQRANAAFNKYFG